MCLFGFTSSNCSLLWYFVGRLLQEMEIQNGNPGDAQSGPFLTVKEAAALLGVSTRTVYGWIRDGRIPSVRFGPKLLRVPRDQLFALGQPDEPG